MSASPPTSGAVPPWSLALGAMLSVQLGSALSVPLIDTIGAAGTAWLRLTAGALLFPVLRHAPDMLALRHMPPTAFGTWMALEPAMGVLLGLVVLSQQPSLVQLAGIALVVTAGAGAQRGGRRTTPTDTREHVPLDVPEPT